MTYTLIGIGISLVVIGFLIFDAIHALRRSLRTQHDEFMYHYMKRGRP